jgi:hypothetical protein
MKNDNLICDKCIQEKHYKEMSHFSSFENRHIHICNECIPPFDKYFIDVDLLEHILSSDDIDAEACDED